MRKHLASSKARFIASMMFIGLLLFSFQNCGKAGFDADLDSNVEGGTADAALTEKYGQSTAEKVQGIPFAFQGGFDTITYNSCAEPHLKSAPGFFTIAAGAFSSQGISLKTEFFDYADENFKPIYPETRLSENQYREFLADSPVNKNVMGNMAIRAKSDLSYLSAVLDAPAIEKDVIPLAGNLSSSLVMDALFPRGTAARYFQFSPEKKNIDSYLVLNSDEAVAEKLREVLTDSSALTFTFRSESKEVSEIASPTKGQPLKAAYGRGYILSFAPTPGSGANNPRRIISSISEYDLATNKTVAGAQWYCDRLWVASTKDQAKYPTLCPAMTFDDLKDQNVRTLLSYWRRHLRPDQWDVNVKKGCVIPKGDNSCYKEQQATPTSDVVDYSGNSECFRANRTDYIGAVPNTACVHFVSLCIRN